MQALQLLQLTYLELCIQSFQLGSDLHFAQASCLIGLAGVAASHQVTVTHMLQAG